MIVVKITLEAFPEKHLELMQTLDSLIEHVEKEQGCKSYYISCDIRNKNNFCILEEWETRKDLNHHFSSLRFGVLLGTKILLRNPLKIHIHTVTRTQGLEAVTMAIDKRIL